ncbi:hypothetical protein PR048_019098 [Dryococelus australis]|uniref:CST complex subunit CTC1 n=1 Tax=Dryococelus australis TaxID=614101 RepID=A0ABQ9H2J0_9NEOP|nr:hypothetical protein PR048_019098 [Dryococelus australis]
MALVVNHWYRLRGNKSSNPCPTILISVSLGFADSLQEKAEMVPYCMPWHASCMSLQLVPHLMTSPPKRLEMSSVNAAAAAGIVLLRSRKKKRKCWLRGIFVDVRFSPVSSGSGRLKLGLGRVYVPVLQGGTPECDSENTSMEYVLDGTRHSIGQLESFSSCPCLFLVHNEEKRLYNNKDGFPSAAQPPFLFRHVFVVNMSELPDERKAHECDRQLHVWDWWLLAPAHCGPCAQFKSMPLLAPLHAPTCNYVQQKVAQLNKRPLIPPLHNYVGHLLLRLCSGRDDVTQRLSGSGPAGRSVKWRYSSHKRTRSCVASLYVVPDKPTSIKAEALSISSISNCVLFTSIVGNTAMWSPGDRQPVEHARTKRYAMPTLLHLVSPLPKWYTIAFPDVLLLGYSVYLSPQMPWLPLLHRVQIHPVHCHTPFAWNDLVKTLKPEISMPGSEIEPRRSRTQSLPDFPISESCRTVPLVGGFPPSLHSGAAPYLPHVTLIGAEDVVFKRRPNLPTLHLPLVKHVWIRRAGIYAGFDAFLDPPAFFFLSHSSHDMSWLRVGAVQIRAIVPVRRRRRSERHLSTSWFAPADVSLVRLRRPLTGRGGGGITPFSVEEFEMLGDRLTNQQILRSGSEPFRIFKLRCSRVVKTSALAGRVVCREDSARPVLRSIVRESDVPPPRPMAGFLELWVCRRAERNDGTDPQTSCYCLAADWTPKLPRWGEVRYGVAPECKGGGNGISSRKPADQWDCQIWERVLRESSPDHLGGRRVV